MNELNKLIEQYERETGGNAIARKHDDNLYADDFVLWLANIPTCGVEQRRFLDEVEKKGYIRKNRDGDLLVVPGILIDTRIQQENFEVDLSKVIKGE